MILQTSKSTEILNRELHIITEVAKALAQPYDLPKLMKMVMDRIYEVIDPAEFGMISLFDPIDGLLHPRASCGQGIINKRALNRIGFKIGESITGIVYQMDGPLLLENPTKIEEIRSNMNPRNRDLAFQVFGEGDVVLQNVMAAPLRVKERRFGVIILGTINGLDVFTQTDAAFLQVLADLIALAIDRGRLEEESASIREAKQADRLRAETMAILSHELRTPLATIKGYTTAMMLDDVSWTGHKIQEFLKMIDDECENLQVMLTEILDSSLIDVGQMSLEYQPVNLKRLAANVAEEFQHRTEQHQIIVDFQQQFPIIDADRRRIKQVFLNIIDNAIKYSTHGGLIMIRGEVRKNDVVMSIADQGVGISPEDLIPLFDKYFRVKSPVGFYVPGTGLGLPVARAIVEAHNGKIWAESQTGEGTTLYFSIPLRHDL